MGLIKYKNEEGKNKEKQKVLEIYSANIEQQ